MAVEASVSREKGSPDPSPSLARGGRPPRRISPLGKCDASGAADEAAPPLSAELLGTVCPAASRRVVERSPPEGVIVAPTEMSKVSWRPNAGTRGGLVKASDFPGWLGANVFNHGSEPTP